MYQRSLFEFELLPVLRSAQMARHLFDCVFSGGFKIDTLSNKHLNEIFERVLIAEGNNSARYSELSGTFDINSPSKKYFSGNYSIINKDPLLKSFEHFWEVDGANIVCKQKSRGELAVFARDFHPYCFISLWLWDKLNTPLFSKPLLNRIVLNLDHMGISCDKSPQHSENHIHINGAYPSVECIMDCMDGATLSKDAIYPPDADRDINLWGTPSEMLNIFGNCARYLIWKHINADSEKNTQDSFETEKNRIMRDIYSFGNSTNKILNSYSLSALKKTGCRADFPLSEAVRYYSDRNEASLFYFLMFLWGKIFGGDANSEDSPLSLMLINQINLIRSYSVMSACTGLEFFTKYFSSHVRKMGSGNPLVKDLRCVLNSGIKNLQFRIGLKNPEKEIPLIFRRTKDEIDKFCGERGIDRDSIKFSIVYHYVKKPRRKSKNFLEKKKRKALASFCNDFLKFAGSTKSLIPAESAAEKIKNGTIYSAPQHREKIDLMRAITGIDAAGNEEDVPPEVYAPYLRRLAKMQRAQKSRADSAKRMPELYPLKKLFHSGEDFEDIATGLRRIDETVNFLSYGENDRISHALALGVNPEKWYSKKRVIRVSKINYLDNLVWLHAQIVKSGLSEFLPFAMWCEKTSKKIAQELYIGMPKSSDIDINVLFEAWKLRRNCPLIWEKISNKDRAAQLRNTDLFELVPDIEKKFDENDVRLEAKIFYYYNNNQSFFKKANEYICLKNDNETLRDEIFNEEIVLKTYTNAIRAVQDSKINEYAEKGIILEVCPSSNIYIGGFKSIEEHPIFRWNPPVRSWLHKKFNQSKIRKNIINVCVNTDDPAIFPTNMENEFRQLRLGAENIMDESDDIKDIEDWINSLKRHNEKVFLDTYRPITISARQQHC